MIEPIAASLIAHGVGDYVIQSHWMALEKTERWLPAWAHGVTYTLPFIFITQSPAALAVICVTHVIIDHYRLAKYVCWFKNQLVPKSERYHFLEGDTSTGYPVAVPAFLGVWLMIITDNILHILINVAAITRL